MSADNYVAVHPHDDVWHVTDGCMSIEMEDCQYRGGIVGRYPSREAALIAAHDYGNTLPILEYGIIELSAIPKTFCGRCYVCVHERSIIDPTLTRCTLCGGTISDSESRTLMQGGTYHNRCKPR